MATGKRNENLDRNIVNGARPACLACVLLVSLLPVASAKTVIRWDFTQGAQGWVGNNFVDGLTVVSEGLAFTSTGIDPWIESRPVDFAGQDLTKVTGRMKSTAATRGANSR